MNRYMLPCVNKKLFGIDCPGRGSQRALEFLFHGKPIEPFISFPAIYSSLLLGVLLGLHIFHKGKSYGKLIAVTAILNGAIVIISYIYKMSTLF